jgi:hypothetical protein
MEVLQTYAETHTHDAAAARSPLKGLGIGHSCKLQDGRRAHHAPKSTIPCHWLLLTISILSIGLSFINQVSIQVHDLA